MLVIYSDFPLSTGELWNWYTKYIEAQRQFVVTHRSDILLIDAAAAFADNDKKRD